MENKDETFSYTYSAAQQAEVERIRQKYTQPQTNKLEQLRKLDRSASQKAQVWSLCFGIIGALILGVGMSFAMTNLIPLPEYLAIAVGSIVGMVGLILVALAYPIYNHVLKKERARVAPEILRLSDELMQ